MIIVIHSRVEKEDEMSCLIEGCNFLLKNIPDEAFLYQRHTEPTYKFQGVSRDIFPFLLVNIGSGVSLIKVNAYLFVKTKCCLHITMNSERNKKIILGLLDI